MRRYLLMCPLLLMTLLAAGCNCADWHWDPPSPLMAAIQNKNTDRVRAIVDARTEDLDAERLHRHAMWGDLDFVGATPLTLAVGDPEMIRILVRGGAAVDAPDKGQQSALQWAVGLGWPESVAVLLELGANPLRRRYEGSKETVLDEALRSENEGVRELARAWASSHKGTGQER